MSMSLTSLGGAGTVTGSKHLVEADGKRILIDCGLFQGLKVLRERNWEPFPVDPRSLDAIVLTHAHLDHSGYLPKLVREGFSGPIYCSSATADLCDILLKDSAHIAEKDAEYANRKGHTKHKPALPLYTVRDAERALKQLRPLEFESERDIEAGAQIRLRRAGHILGAATVELSWQSRTLVFSGDLGRYDDVFMPDPEPVTAADYVIVESTYGDRTHPKTDPMEALGAVVERTVRRGGTVVIPAFAVGRTQVLLYHLWMLKQAGRIATVPIFLDSPMAINATELLCQHLEDHRFSADVCEQSCAIATYVRDVEESKAITANPMPKIVIAGSGMATGGRVLHHIKAFGPDSRNAILFAGYQAAGTRGARLMAGETEVKMFGQWIPIRAEVANLPELSAHADAEEIIRWLSGFKRPPRHTYIVHGEPEASDALRVRIGRNLGWDASVVDDAKRYDLS
ncbi:MAG: MBL fold metallo-hydrolase [Alphaproteobacteria bacterium]|nr:MAG: MBL fold metallo-hydrolase [Alphaproteobacteria bacterium]